MPTRLRFYRWMKEQPGLKNDYARARLAWADAWAERVMTISLNPDQADFPGKSFDPEGKVFIDNGLMMWAKHLTDNIKFMVGKYAPRTYGQTPVLPPPEMEPVNKIELVGVPSQHLKVSWMKHDDPPTKIERVIVDPKGNEQPADPPRPEPPRMLTYDPAPPPADLTPDEWATVNRVLAMIPEDGDPTAGEVFAVIEKALQEHFAVH